MLRKAFLCLYSRKNHATLDNKNQCIKDKFLYCLLKMWQNFDLITEKRVIQPILSLVKLLFFLT